MAGHLNLKQRFLTFIVLMIVTTLSLKLHPPSLALLILGVSIDEYHRCVRQLPYAIKPVQMTEKGAVEQKQTPAFTTGSRIGHVVCAVIIGASALWGAVVLTATTLCINSTLLIHSMMANRSTDRPLTTAALVMIGDMFGHVYLSFLWSHALLIYIDQSKWQSINQAIDWHGLTMVVYTIFTVVIGENGALFFGRVFGKNPLAKAISPNKSIEGAVANVVTSTIASILFSHYYIPYFTFLDSLFLGFSVGLLGTMGDLFESFLKRAVNVKDVGSILPGTGGFLDRVDGLTVCFPVVYYYLKLRFDELQH